MDLPRRALLAVVALLVLAAAWPLYSRLRDERNFRKLTPKQHVIAAMQICAGKTPMTSAEKFERHLAAIPANYWAREDVANCLPPVKARADRPEDFESFTPQQHYAAAIYVCQDPPRRDDEFDPNLHDCLLRSAGDFSRVIRHLEAIPKDSLLYADATRALRLVKVQRDRPQDFEADRVADSKQCLAETEARLRRLAPNGFCGNMLYDTCDIFDATNMGMTHSWHTSTEDMSTGLAEWEREKP